MSTIKNIDEYLFNNLKLNENVDSEEISSGDMVIMFDEDGLSHSQKIFIESKPYFIVKNIIIKDDKKFIDIGYRINFPIEKFIKINKEGEIVHKYPEIDIPIDPVTGEMTNIDYKSLPKIKEFTLIISDELLEYLKMMHNVIAKTLITNNFKTKSQHTFLDVNRDGDNVKNNGTITSLSATKIMFLATKEGINLNDNLELKNKKNVFWTTTSRVETRLAAICSDLYGDFFTPTIIEDFVNEFKSIMSRKDIFNYFEIIKGEDIKKIYLNKNEKIHDMTGTIKGSCMIGKDSNILNLYTTNPEKVGLLVLNDPNNKGKILGRALLWENLLKPKGRTFMDRIYSVNPDIVNIFIDFAIKNKWIYKHKDEQNFYLF